MTPLTRGEATRRTRTATMSRVRVSNDAVPFRRRVSSTRSFLGGGAAAGATADGRRADPGPTPAPRREMDHPAERDGLVHRPSLVRARFHVRILRHRNPSQPRTYSSPRRGPTCERGRFGEEARSGSVSQAGSVGGERAVESRVGVARARRFATHFFSHRRTRPVMTCACARRLARPRVDGAAERLANPRSLAEIR